MTKDVLVSISGLHMGEVEGENEQENDGGRDTVELIVPGQYFFRNEKHYVMYEEVTEGCEEPVHSMIKVGTDYMEVTKKGMVNVHMIFEKGKKNVTYYNTPYGSIEIGICASKVDVKETDDALSICVEYHLDMNHEKVADCQISINVQSKGIREGIF